VERVIQEKFLGIMGRQQSDQLVKDQQYIIRLYKYLHKLQLNLSNIMRNKQPQEALVEAAFRLDQTYTGSDSIEELLTAVKYYMVWLKTNELTPQTRQVIDFLDNMIADIENEKVVQSNEKSVFISYNHKDAATAQLLKIKLEEKGIKVIMDTTAMKAGTSIEEFISESIRTAQATVSVVSNNSLLSGWVAMETVNMMNFEMLFKGKKLIPCCLSNDFTNDNFVNNAITAFEKRLTEIAALIQEHDKNYIDSRDLNDEKSRINFLKYNLDGIVGKLKKTLYINIEGDNLDNNLPKILEAIETEK
jgi:hypothetical protein